MAVVIPLNNFPGPADDTVTAQTYYRMPYPLLSPKNTEYRLDRCVRSSLRATVCFFVLCNRHRFNRVPDPPPRDRLGVTYLPFTISSDTGYADLPLALLGDPSAGSGGSFRAVAPAAESGIGLLLRGERVGSENVPNNAYAQDGQELSSSAGACRAGSLASARFRPCPAPPARLSAPFACHIPRIFCFQVLSVFSIQ